MTTEYSKRIQSTKNTHTMKSTPAVKTCKAAPAQKALALLSLLEAGLDDDTRCTATVIAGGDVDRSAAATSDGLRGRQSPLADDAGRVNNPVESLGCLWRLGEGLLNELGLHEGALAHDEWSTLMHWAAISQGREARCLTPTGEFPTQRLRHSVRFRDALAVDEFLVDRRVQRLGLTVLSNEQLTETLEDRRVTLEGAAEASALELMKVASTLIRAAYRSDGLYEGYKDAEPGATNELPGGFKTNLLQRCAAHEGVRTEVALDLTRRLKLRSEFLGDAIAVRHLLAPFVLDWRDAENSEGLQGAEQRVSGWDRDIELTLAKGAPRLDDLRWYLNQAVDMHVAAESLHYAHRYTGERLPHDLVENMTPSVQVRRDMADRLEALRNSMQGMLERIEGACASVTATLPKAPVPTSKRYRQGQLG